MSEFQPRDPGYAKRVRDSFERQRIMGLLGASLARVEPGVVAIELPFREDLTQQHGYFHAGIVGTIADSAGGYAGYTLMPEGSSVLSVEYRHMHLLAPAEGTRLIATGSVLRSGRTLTVCTLEVAIEKDGRSSRCAFGTQTLICLVDRPDGPKPA